MPHRVMYISKTATIFWRLFLMCIMTTLLSASYVQAQTSSSYRPPVNIGLTAAEKVYLAGKGKLTFVCDPDWPPFEFIDSTGHYSGMAADYLQLISNRIGIPFHRIPTDSWTESLEIAKAGECDIMPILNKTPERSTFLEFTTPYFTTRYVIIGRGYTWVDSGLKGMAGKTMAVVKGYKMDEDLRRDYKDIRLVSAETMQAALQQVYDGKADATVSTPMEASHLIRKFNFDSLKVIGHTKLTNKPSMGTRKADIILQSVMQKAIDSITESDKKMISIKWVTESEQINSNRFFAIKAIGISLICLAAIFITYRKLRSSQA